MKRPERRAREVLAAADITDPPTPIDELAVSLGAEIAYEPFKGGISGMLFRNEGRVVIGVNPRDGERRQRFTIAHELGHLLLHEGRSLIVDTHIRINLRDAASSMGTRREETEANAFAAEILMPRESVEAHANRELSERPSLTANQLIEGLSDIFQVSSQAMSVRLSALGILSPLIAEG